MPQVNPDIATSIRDRLIDDAGVSGMTTRIYAIAAPQNAALPFITYELEDDDNAMTQDGAASLTKSTFTIRAIAQRYGDAKKLANHIRVALVGYRGTLGVHTIAGIFPGGKQDIPIPPRQGKEDAEEEVAMRFTVAWYQAPDPVGVS